MPVKCTLLWLSNTELQLQEMCNIRGFVYIFFIFSGHNLTFIEITIIILKKTRVLTLVISFYIHRNFKNRCLYCVFLNILESTFIYITQTNIIFVLLSTPKFILLMFYVIFPRTDFYAATYWKIKNV